MPLHRLANLAPPARRPQQPATATAMRALARHPDTWSWQPRRRSYWVPARRATLSEHASRHPSPPPPSPTPRLRPRPRPCPRPASSLSMASLPLPLSPTAPSRAIHLPRVIDPETYRAVLPRAWRVAPADGTQTSATDHPTPSSSSTAAPASAPPRNPAWFYVLMFMFIGSQAIHSLVLRKEREAFDRASDARIRVLRELIKRLQRGEEVDVRRVLGTGDERAEKSWEELIREIEEEEELWRRRETRNARRGGKNARADKEAGTGEASHATANSVAGSMDAQPQKPAFF
ncbi:hypothetical protein KEM52_005679 [Ascosphaera acerosa]|nr:hypothetical protein KEM52_005679 [Ascosphaera acerosa]